MAYSGRYQPNPGGPAPPPPPRPPSAAPRPGKKSNDGLLQRLTPLIKKLEDIDLETDDLLMLLILYLMYRESGDKELLITLGAMLLS